MIEEMKRLERKWFWLNVWDISRATISILGLIGTIIGLIAVSIE